MELKRLAIYEDSNNEKKTLERKIEEEKYFNIDEEITLIIKKLKRFMKHTKTIREETK